MLAQGDLAAERRVSLEGARADRFNHAAELRAARSRAREGERARMAVMLSTRLLGGASGREGAAGREGATRRASVACASKSLCVRAFMHV